MKPSPPKLFMRFFRWFCDPQLLTYLEGDLIEIFENNIERKGLSKARLLFVIEVIKLFRPGIIRSFFHVHTNISTMFKHNILISLRNFNRHKLAFLINLIGLTSGLICALFIYLWVDHEYSFDTFHENEEQLYRIISDGNGNETLLNTNILFTQRLTEEIPEIEASVNSSWATIDSYLSSENEFIPFKGEFATPAFFDFFSYELISGNPKTILDQPKSVVLSEETAMILFQSKDVIGKSVEWGWYNFTETLEVTGVFEGPPANSSEQFDYVVSFDVFEERFRERIERGQNNARTFFKLSKGADLTLVNAKIADYINRNYENPRNYPYLIPFSSFYLYNKYENGQAQGGRIVYVKLFTFLAILILIVACINFMNFSTARASTRMKEMGIKKVIGSTRMPLIFQHFSESMLMNVLAGIAALCLVWVLLPEFRAMTGKEIFLTFTPSMAAMIIAIIFISGIFSGIYPALYLSGFSPILALNGKFSGTFKDKWLRKGLVVFQFCVSLILIVAVIVIQHQVSFLKNKELGYNKDHLISLNTKGLDRNKRASFIEASKQIPGVMNASSITHALFGAQRSTANLQWQDKDPDARIWFDQGFVYYDMLELLEIEMLYGRAFSRDFGNEENKIIINETAWKLTGLEDPIGKIITMGEVDHEIIGITKDFHFHSLHEEIRPNIFTFNDFATRIVIKISAQNEASTLASLEDLYAQFNPSYPFEYTFQDQVYQQKYVTEGRVEELSKYFAGLAIIISCLGLFGLATFSVEQRRREISIRKILGAPPKALFYLLSKDYLVLIIIAILMGIPIAFFAMTSWLQNFAYHIDIQWQAFLVAIFCMFVLSFIVISVQVIKAATASPVERM